MRGACSILCRVWIGLVLITPAMAQSIEPLPAVLSEGNAALFVGINQYARTNFSSLRFAVNDAVAQAETFALRLNLVAPDRTFLLLAGEPTGTNIHRLRRLREAGARVLPEARRNSILQSLETARRLADSSNSLLIVFFSGHGQEHERTPYFVPEDGEPALPASFVSLVEVRNSLDARLDRKRWLFVDACRLELIPGKGAYRFPEVTENFRRAFAATSGRLVFVSCDAGQVSLEDERSQQGVFTGKLLEGIDNAGANLDSEFVTIGHLVNYASREANRRAKEIASFDHRIAPGQVQRPWYEGPGDALSTPIGISPDVKAALARREKRQKGAKLRLQESRIQHPKLFADETTRAIERAIDSWAGPENERLLNKIESLLSAKGHNDPEAFLAWWREQLRATAVAVVSSPKGNGIEPEPRVPTQAIAPGNEGKTLVLLGPMDGLAPKHAAAALAKLETTLRRHAHIELRRVSFDFSNGILEPSTAKKVLAEHGAQLLLAGTVTAGEEPSRKLDYNGTRFNNQIWSATLTMIATAREDLAVRSRVYAGQATFLDGQHVADGTADAVAGAIEKFAADTAFLRELGLGPPVAFKK